MPFVTRQRWPGQVERNPYDYRQLPPETPGPDANTPSLVDRMKQPNEEPPDAGWLPTVARVGGALIGGAAGSFLPVGGTAAGAMIGGGLGAGAGEWIAEMLEKSRGVRKEINPWQVAGQTAIGAIPLGKLGTIASGAVKGAALGGGGHAVTEFAENRTPTFEGTAMAAGVGGVFGGAASGALSMLERARAPRTAPVPEGVGPGRYPYPAPEIPVEPYPNLPPSFQRRLDAGMEIPPNMRRPEMGPHPFIGPEPPPPAPGPGSFWRQEPAQQSFPETPVGFEQKGSGPMAALLRIREKAGELGIETPGLAQAESAAMQDVAPAQAGGPRPPAPSLVRPLLPSGLDADPNAVQLPQVNQFELPTPPPESIPDILERARQLTARTRRMGSNAPLPEPAPSLTRPLVPSGLDPDAVAGGTALPVRPELPPPGPPRPPAPPAAPPVPRGPAPSLVRPLNPSGLDSDALAGGDVLPQLPGRQNRLLTLLRGNRPDPIDMNALPDVPEMQVLDDVGLNASGESAASAEALSRQAGMASRGEQFVVADRAGNVRPLIGPDAVDYRVRPGETYAVRQADGTFRVLDDQGGRLPVLETPGQLDAVAPTGPVGKVSLAPEPPPPVAPPIAAAPPAEPPGGPQNALQRLLGMVKEGEQDLERGAPGFFDDPNVDRLTGLANREGFDRRAPGAGGLARIIMRGDLDNFKAVNDTLGHAEGDRALQVAADALKKALREGDVAARKGGDEFALDLAGGGNPTMLRDRLEASVEKALADAGFGNVGGRKIGMSIGYGADEGAADLAAIARKKERGVSQPRQPEAPPPSRAGGAIAIPKLEPGTVPEPGGYYRVNPKELVLDPKRFQYKQGVSDRGVRDALKGKYDPNRGGVLLVWRDPADGRSYVVNGHHRADLAQRANAPDVATRYIDAPDAQTARAIGALTNISEGSGNAVDAAKWFRDTGNNLAGLERQGVALGTRIARDGEALSKLNDDLFNKVATGGMSESRAVTIGASGLDHEGQAGLVKLIARQEAKGRKLSEGVIRELAEDIKANAATVDVSDAGQQPDMFSSVLGDRKLANTAIERASLREWLKNTLSKDKRLFGFVSKANRAKELERGGNVIDVDQSKAIATDAAELEERFGKLVNYKGPVSAALSDAAERILKGEKPDVVRADLYKTIRAAVEADLQGGPPAAPVAPVRAARVPETPTGGSAAAADAPQQEVTTPKLTEQNVENVIEQNPPVRSGGDYEDFRRSELEYVGDGEPGLSTTSERLGQETVIAYRDAAGKPVAMARITQGPDGPQVFSIAAAKDRGLATGRAVKAVLDEIEKHNPTGVVAGLSEDAQNLLRKYNARRGLAGKPKVSTDVAPEAPPKVDMTDAGPQPRLPGDVGDVRDMEVPTPTEKLPQQTLRLGQQDAPESMRKPQPTLMDAPEPVQSQLVQPRQKKDLINELRGPNAEAVRKAILSRDFPDDPITATELADVLDRAIFSKYQEGLDEAAGQSFKQVAARQEARFPGSTTPPAKPPAPPAPEAPPAAAAPDAPPAKPAITRRHEVRNQEAVDRIAADMKERGWQGRPALVVRDGDELLGWTATHRLAAAEKAGLTDIPTIEVDGAKLREAGYDLKELTQIGKKKRIAALREIGEDKAADLLEQEQAIGGRAQHGTVTDKPRVPDNVRDFLVRQLKYTAAQVDAMDPDDAYRIGRDRVRNPNIELPKTPAPGEVVRPDILPKLKEGAEAAPAVRRPGEVPVGAARKNALHELVTKKTDPKKVPGDTMARTAAERQAAGEKLTLAEQRELGIPPPEPKQSVPDLRKKGISPRQLEARAKYMKALADNPSEENVGKLAAEIDAQAERINKKGLKAGREETLEKSDPEGFIIGSGLGGLQDIQKVAKLAKQNPELAWRATMAAMGGLAGWNLDEDHPGRNAILGALAGGSLQSITKAILKAKVNAPAAAIAKKASQRIGPEAVRSARDKTKDIGLFELAGGTPERTIPEQFERARPAFEKFTRALRDEHAKTKAIIPQKRVTEIRDRIVGPVIAEIRRDAKAAKEAGHAYKASYMTAFANRLAGYQTIGQRTVGTLTKGKVRPDAFERQIAGNTYRILTGWGLDTALQNLTQPLLAMAHVPPTFIAKGIKEYTTDAGRELVKKHLLELERPMDLIESTLGDYGEAVKKLPDSQVFLRKTDNINRGVTFLSAYRYAKTQGAADDAAAKWAGQVVRKTQGEPGALGSNPFHAGPVSGSLRPFTKYPAIFTEHMVDVLKQAGRGENLAGAATLFGTGAGLVMLGKLTGIDLENMLVTGGRPLGFDISHPGRSLKRIVTGDAFPVTRAAKELAGHLAGTADHDFMSMDNFLDSDVGSFAVPRYPRKAIETVSNAMEGKPVIEKRGAGGKLQNVTTQKESWANLLGFKTTRQTERQHALSDFNEKASAAANAHKQRRADAYEKLGKAYEDGDGDLMREAMQDIGDTGAVKRFLKRRTQLPEERFYQTLPPAVRQELRDEFEALRKTRP